MEQPQLGETVPSTLRGLDFETSNDINELLTAVSEAQGEIYGVAKNKTNPHFKSGYADLAACWGAIREVLPKHGLSVTQFPCGGSDGAVNIVTVLGHKSGQWMRGVLPMRPVKPDPQGYGSAITYGRRYGLAAALGLAQDDDDGNAASGGKNQYGVTTVEYTPQEKETYDTLLQEGNALDFYLFNRQIGLDKAQTLFSSFPKGEITAMKAKARKLEAEGNNIYRAEYLSPLVEHIHNEDVEGIREIQESIDNPIFKGFLKADLSEMEKSKLRELLA